MLDAILRYPLGIVLTTLLGGLSAYGMAQLQPERYSASAQVILAEPTAVLLDSSLRIDSSRRAVNAAATARTLAVAQKVAAIVRFSDPETVRANYSVEASEASDLFVVTATGATADEAADLANAVVEGYGQQAVADINARVQPAVDELDARIRLLRNDIAELGSAGNDQLELRRTELEELIFEQERDVARLQFERFAFGNGISTVDPALPPAEPFQPAPVRAALVGALMAGLAAVGVAWWRQGKTASADDRHDPARVLGAPLLGEVPDFRHAGAPDLIPAASAPFSQAGEAYQFILASLTYALGQTGARTVLVTSATPGDGKSVTSLNLAIAAARDERRVVLVDADARMRGLTELAQVDHPVGLSNLRDEHVPVERALAPIPATGENGPSLVVIGDGAPDLAVFFRTGGFRRAFRRVVEHADLVLVDSPPILAVAETSAVAGQVDGIVLVVNRGTRMALLADVVEQLQFVGTPLLGYVFNRGSSRLGYGSYYSVDPSRGRAKPPRSFAGLRRAERTQVQAPETTSVPSSVPRLRPSRGDSAQAS